MVTPSPETKLQFELVSPDALVCSEQVDMVVIPGSEGDLGVLKKHSPMIVTLRPGLASLYQNGKIVSQRFISGGFAEITAERCTVLAEEIFSLEELAAYDAQARLEKANEAYSSATEALEQKAAQREQFIAQAMQRLQ